MFSTEFWITYYKKHTEVPEKVQRRITRQVKGLEIMISERTGVV